MTAKKIHSTLGWLVFASLVSLVTILQVGSILRKERLAVKHESGPPAKTKSGRELVLASHKDPQAAYVEACSKGLTIQQIRWILDDFRDAGLGTGGNKLGRESMDSDVPRGAAAHRWYHRSLVLALGLNRQQSNKAAESLAALYSARISQQRLAPFDWFHDRTNQFSNPIDSAYQPWRLCTLEPPQVAITWQDGYRPARSDSDTDTAWIMKNMEPSASRTLLRGPEDMVDTPPNFPGWAHDVNNVFPLMESQKFESESFGLEMDLDAPTSPMLIGNIRKLHAAQLMLLLLMNPEYADDIRSMTEK